MPAVESEIRGQLRPAAEPDGVGVGVRTDALALGARLVAVPDPLGGADPLSVADPDGVWDGNDGVDLKPAGCP
jgi:hypothetical protein